MKKWIFWLTMFLISLANGAIFFAASLSAMRQGISGVDNQGALIFIPLLWLAAALVLLVLNLCTLISSRRIERERKIFLLDVFCLSGLSARASAGRITFFAASFLLMLLAYLLFAPGPLAVFYALSGGLLLLFLLAWKNAGTAPLAKR